MAQLNGHVEPHERPESPTQHLGKRKRTMSPDADETTNHKTNIQQTLKDALQLIKRHDPSSRILKFPLEAHGEDGRMIKRQKTEVPDQETDTVESRILNAAYTSVEDLMQDVTIIKETMFDEDGMTNGTSTPNDHIKEQINIIWNALSNIQPQQDSSQQIPTETTTKPSPRPREIPPLPRSQVLSLRSQTEQGIRQLFSGLPQDSSIAIPDGRKLPNGFEFTEILTVDKSELQGRESRKFGDVFAPHRNTKTLEMPRASRSQRGKALNFIQPFEGVAPSSRNDYKFANLSTGAWLKYAVRDKSKLEAKTAVKNNTIRTDALFKAAYSTFAPSTDNSQSVITDFERSQQWWKKNSGIAVGGTSLEGSKFDHIPHGELSDIASDKDLDEMVANFIPDEDLDNESEKVLEEIAELIETLSSFQTMRSLEVARGPISASKPSREEQDTYELLRNQLKLLVSSLPPFAVAKLDGDQLEELNISTRMLFSAPEFVGTAQVDDYTLRRNRAAQAATSAAGRSMAAVPARNTYNTPASAYNAQARAYNNMPTTAFVPRPPTVTMYNAQRPTINTQTGAYGQPQYRPNGPAIHTPSIQQFQRPMVNGYSATTPTAQSPYAQRPPQPGFQSRPVVNGEVTSFQQRPYSAVSASHSANAASPSGQPRTDDVARQTSSATPQPHMDGTEATAVTA